MTAFIKYVLDGYKVDAVRYIMKDVLNTAIPECMDAILRKMEIRQVSFSFMEGEKSYIQIIYCMWRVKNTN